MQEKKIIYFENTGTCPVRDVLSKIGDKWSILVLASLQANGKLRFSEIQRSIGDISQRMLTVTLRSMEADGLILREIYAEVPPRVDYELTALGYELFKYVSPLVNWAVNNIETIQANRSKFAKQ